jgi:hypothetical protein
MEVQYTFCEVETKCLDATYLNFVHETVNNNLWITANALRFLDPLSPRNVIDHSSPPSCKQRRLPSDLTNLRLRAAVMSSTTAITIANASTVRTTRSLAWLHWLQKLQHITKCLQIINLKMNIHVTKQLFKAILVVECFMLGLPFNPDDEGDMYHRNVGSLSSDYKALFRTR